MGSYHWLAIGTCQYAAGARAILKTTLRRGGHKTPPTAVNFRIVSDGQKTAIRTRRRAVRWFLSKELPRGPGRGKSLPCPAAHLHAASPRELNSVRHLLLVTATRIGDAVLSTGLLAHLIERYPEARITIAAGPDAAPLFEAVPGIERLITVS